MSQYIVVLVEAEAKFSLRCFIALFHDFRITVAAGAAPVPPKTLLPLTPLPRLLHFFHVITDIS